MSPWPSPHGPAVAWGPGQVAVQQQQVVAGGQVQAGPQTAACGAADDPWASVLPKEPYKKTYNQDDAMGPINEILNGAQLPKWDDRSKQSTPKWNDDFVKMADRIIKVTKDQLEESANLWTSKKLENERKKREGHQWLDYRLGPYERAAIWDRACRSGAVFSIVLTITGLQLEEKYDGSGPDRNKAARNVWNALYFASDPGDVFRKSILDVVCSHVDKGQQGQGASRATGIY